MREKILTLLLFLLLFFVTVSKAQIAGHTDTELNSDQKNLFLPSTFKRSVTIFIAYGFPNVDENYLPRYEHMFHGNISQAGPLLAALGYQFSRRVSLDAIIIRGIVSTPYYDYSSPTQQMFIAKFYNWSFMLDVVRFIPV